MSFQKRLWMPNTNGYLLVVTYILGYPVASIETYEHPLLSNQQFLDYLISWSPITISENAGNTLIISCMRQISNHWPLPICSLLFSLVCRRKNFFVRERATDIFFTHAQIIASLLVTSVRIMWYAHAARFLELAGILLQVGAFPAAWSWGLSFFGTLLLRKIPSAFVIVSVRASIESL